MIVVASSHFAENLPRSWPMRRQARRTVAELDLVPPQWLHITMPNGGFAVKPKTFGLPKTKSLRDHEIA
jgi:hypothetical protein